ncbi:hypothetical protein LCGC14_2303810, partial [marine sediment metagenome]
VDSDAVVLGAERGALTALEEINLLRTKLLLPRVDADHELVRQRMRADVAAAAEDASTRKRPASRDDDDDDDEDEDEDGGGGGAAAKDKRKTSKRRARSTSDSDRRFIDVCAHRRAILAHEIAAERHT